MYHHAESPEVIHATLAEWERTVAAHQTHRAAERAFAETADHSLPQPLRSLFGRLQRLFQPTSRMHDQPAG